MDLIGLSESTSLIVGIKSIDFAIKISPSESLKVSPNVFEGQWNTKFHRHQLGQ